jgi:hypothetical protein
MLINYKWKTISLQPGDIVLFRNNFVWHQPMTWLSALVRFFTRCEFNHCALIVANWDVAFISEAVNQGIVTRPLEQHLERSKSRIMILRSREPLDIEPFCIRANSVVGSKYDYSALFWFQLIYRITGNWYGPTNDAAADRMVCSEFVAWVYRLDKWWLYSSKEIMNHRQFQWVFVE